MKLLKQAIYIRYVIAELSKFIQISLQTSSIFEYQKVLELVSRPHFSQNFLIKIFLLYYYINWPNLIFRLCLLSKLFCKMCLVFHAWEFDGVITFDIWKVKIWLSQEWKELLKWNKKHLSLFHKCLSLDLQQTSENVADTTFKKKEVCLHMRLYKLPESVNGTKISDEKWHAAKTKYLKKKW